MTACLLVNDGVYQVVTDAAPSSCAGYVLQTGAEYSTNNPFSELDNGLALKLLGFELGLFILAFSCGFICRKLGR